jgi:hypothetical protein
MRKLVDQPTLCNELDKDKSIDCLCLSKEISGKTMPEVILDEKARRGGGLSTTVPDPNSKIARGVAI